MVATIIAAFIVLQFVVLLRRRTGDLLLAKLHPRHHDKGEERLPLLILPVNSQLSSVTPVPIGATMRALPVNDIPIPIPTWHEAAESEPVDTVEHEEWLPLKSYHESVHEADHTMPVTPLDDAPDGATIVFQRPANRPVQILPGRFTVVAGDPRHEDIRFIGQIGAEPRLTIGRNAGAPHEVVTLQSPTVSRQHAQMQFADGCWIISNLSETNPVVVNDEALDRIGSAHRLVDGDRVELGEVMLRFHAH